MANALIFIALFGFICQCDGHMEQPKVTTPLGKIIGTTMVTRYGRNINAYLGIPYAQPPIGFLRFRNPLPVTPWQDTLMADTEPPPCPQVGENGTFFGQEDCLFLNVYTPQLDKQNLLPTMVYIHGGAFQKGHTKLSYLGPNYILDKDVVLVTLQYRLGVLGFLSTGDSEAPGNFGLKDQALALRWVQDNIKSFGGNPGNVTLFGQSSGSVSVNYHVLSKASKGLFHRYITQSGVVLCPWGFVKSKKYIARAFNLGNSYGCQNDSSHALIECLRRLRTEALIITPENVFSGVQKLVPVTWIPTDEPESPDAFLTEHPAKLILGSKFQDLPNISGAVKDEGLVVTLRLHANKTLYDALLYNITEFLNFMTAPVLSKNDSSYLARNLENFYFNDVDVSDRKATLAALTNLLSDICFLFPQVLQLQLITPRSDSKCYFYSFEYRGTFSKTSITLKNNDDVGVVHADDLIYLFPSRPEEYGFPNLTLSEEDHKMIDIMVDLWTNFATYGYPKTSYTRNPKMWKPYSHHHYHLRIGDGHKATMTGQIRFIDERLHFWAIQALKLLIWSDSLEF